MDPGLVGLCMKGTLMGMQLPMSRNWPALGGAVPPGQ